MKIMNRTFTILAGLFVVGAMMSPQALAQERGRGRGNGGGGNGHRTEQQARPVNKNNGSNRGGRPGGMGGMNRPNKNDRPDNSGVRPGNQSRPNNNNGYRPGGNKHDRPNNGYRPGNNNRPNNNNGYRPGGNKHDRPNNNNGYRPGGNHNNFRPDHGYRPDHRPDHGYRPDHRPGWRPPYHAQAPRPPHMYYRPWRRPVPPHGFRPGPRGPRFSTILGITLGTALNVSLNALINGGYNVVGYGPSAVYMDGVNLFDCYWPNATLNYIDNGLRNSEFTYSTAGYDRSRYNRLFQRLTMAYGSPVTMQNNGDSCTATWWGYDNGYVTLSYFPDYANNGLMRYYTVLSMGN